MYSHSLKKFLKETLHLSGYWLFLRKWNNKKIVIFPPPPPPPCPLPHIILTPQKYKKTLCPTKFWPIFKLSNQNNYQTMWESSIWKILLMYTVLGFLILPCQVLTKSDTEFIKKSYLYVFCLSMYELWLTGSMNELRYS